MYGIIGLFALLWEALFDLQVEGILDEVGSVAAASPVPVTDPEHVHRLPFLDVRGQDEGIFVDFGLVSLIETYPGGEGKLFNNIFWLDVRQMGSVRRGWS